MGGSSKREGVDSGRELYGANISGQDIRVNSIFIRRSGANFLEVFWIRRILGAIRCVSYG